jgi:hypothetical protein
VGAALTGGSEEHAVSQSTICRCCPPALLSCTRPSCRFEKLEITAVQVKRLLPPLQAWLAEARRRDLAGLPVLGPDPAEPVSLAGREGKRRKKRTVFPPDTVTRLATEFLADPSPTAGAMQEMADRWNRNQHGLWFKTKTLQAWPRPGDCPSVVL